MFKILSSVLLLVLFLNECHLAEHENEATSRLPIYQRVGYSRDHYNITPFENSTILNRIDQRLSQVVDMEQAQAKKMDSLEYKLRLMDVNTQLQTDNLHGEIKELSRRVQHVETVTALSQGAMTQLTSNVEHVRIQLGTDYMNRCIMTTPVQQNTSGGGRGGGGAGGGLSVDDKLTAIATLLHSTRMAVDQVQKSVGILEKNITTFNSDDRIKQLQTGLTEIQKNIAALQGTKEQISQIEKGLNQLQETVGSKDQGKTTKTTTPSPAHSKTEEKPKPKPDNKEHEGTGNATHPGTSEKEPAKKEEQPAGKEKKPVEKDTNPTGKESKPGEKEKQPEDKTSTDKDKHPAEKEKPPAEKEKTPSNSGNKTTSKTTPSTKVPKTSSSNKLPKEKTNKPATALEPSPPVHHETERSATTPKPTEELPCNCAEIPGTRSGIYRIRLRNGQTTYVNCDLETNSNKWTVIMNRSDGSINFFRNWLEYKNGFGNIYNEFWIGLDKLYQLTSSALHELLIELEDFNGNTRFARYSNFAIGDENEGYALHLLGQYAGDAGDSLSYHAGQKFSTFDVDNDAWPEGNCAQLHMGGWWYRSCDMCNLHGRYLNGPTNELARNQGMYWNEFNGPYYSLKRAKMMIRQLF